MEAVISESLFEKQKSSFDMMNKNWVFILLFSDITIIIIIIMAVTNYAMFKLHDDNRFFNPFY